MGQDILRQCHPDAVSTVRNWLTVIQTRWDEVNSWAGQRDDKLAEHLSTLRDNAKLLEELLAWLIGAEATLRASDSQPIPQDLAVVEELIRDHQDFQGDMQLRQPDVERITKPGKRRGEEPDPMHSTPIQKGKKGFHPR